MHCESSASESGADVQPYRATPSPLFIVQKAFAGMDQCEVRFTNLPTQEVNPARNHSVGRTRFFTGNLAMAA